MLTNPQGVTWPGWSADAFRLRWLSFYERADVVGMDPFLLLEHALDMETLGWGWARLIDYTGAEQSAFVTGQWPVQESLEWEMPDGTSGAGIAHSWRTVKLFKGSKADVQTVLGMFVWWAAGAVLWD